MKEGQGGKRELDTSDDESSCLWFCRFKCHRLPVLLVTLLVFPRTPAAAQTVIIKDPITPNLHLSPRKETTSLQQQLAAVPLSSTSRDRKRCNRCGLNSTELEIKNIETEVRAERFAKHLLNPIHEQNFHVLITGLSYVCISTQVVWKATKKLLFL